MTNRARSSSPRSVSRTHRDVASSKRASVHAGVEQRTAVEVEGPTEGLAVGEDLRLEHVLHARGPCRPLRGAAGRCRTPRRTQHPDSGSSTRCRPKSPPRSRIEEVVDALLRQARRGKHPGEPATDDHDIGLDPLRCSLLDRGVRVFGVVLQLPVIERNCATPSGRMANRLSRSSSYFFLRATGSKSNPSAFGMIIPSSRPSRTDARGRCGVRRIVTHDCHFRGSDRSSANTTTSAATMDTGAGCESP